MTAATGYTFGTRLRGTLTEARPLVEEALRTEGFGILTEIDVQATLKLKLGLDRDPYVILGACNPALAHRAIDAEPAIGALLPCNVVLRDDLQGGTIVEIMDPGAALGLVGSPAVAEIAAEARERLTRVVAALERAG